MSTADERLAGLSRDLTENGLAFLHRSVAEMSAQPATLRSLSFAVVDLAAAVEVLMKARLVREHWTLICSEPDKATTVQMLAGTAKTVTSEQAIKRLENVAGVAMYASGHASRVVEVASLRNRAIHFAMVGVALAGCRGRWVADWTSCCGSLTPSSGVRVTRMSRSW